MDKSLGFKWPKQIIIFLILGLSIVSSASENLGSFQIHDFVLEPQLYVNDESASNPSGFHLRNSRMGVRWEKEGWLRGVITVGTLDLSTRPKWYDATLGVQSPNTSLQGALAESYLEYDHPYWGQFRLGLLPVGFGSEGLRHESRLRFPRSLLFAERFVWLRDLGASYTVSSGSLFTHIAAHNGEVGDDKDRRFFQTMNVGWRGAFGSHAGLSGTVGRFRDNSTRESRFRISNAYAFIDLYRLSFLAEGSAGEIEKQDIQRIPFWNYHFDLQIPLSDQLAFAARYDVLEPNTQTIQDQKMQWMGGLIYDQLSSTSQLYFWFVKNLEEHLTVADDEVRLVWRMTSVSDKASLIGDERR